MSSHTDPVRILWLKDIRLRFRGLKHNADRAIAQVTPSDLFLVPNAPKPLWEGSNSIAVIMKHMAGNMLSRWTDFRTTDGEKANRHRDSEFQVQMSEDELKAYWEKGWCCVLAALDSLEPAELEKTIIIRGESHGIVEAVQRQFAHYAYHCGQLIYLARYWAGPDWQSLSIPRGQSEAYNARKAAAGDQGDKGISAGLPN